tara:strand:- start:3026 stop:3184 length:159 start_codon:yes stop_codon:yes gene_type:complete
MMKPKVPKNIDKVILFPFGLFSIQLSEWIVCRTKVALGIKIGILFLITAWIL